MMRSVGLAAGGSGTMLNGRILHGLKDWFTAAPTRNQSSDSGKGPPAGEPLFPVAGLMTSIWKGIE